MPARQRWNGSAHSQRNRSRYHCVLEVSFPFSKIVITSRNIEYGRADGQSLQLDAFVPEGVTPFPAAILVHGGGWVAGDRYLSVEPLFRPLLDAGIACFSISYRLAGQMSIFGAAVED